MTTNEVPSTPAAAPTSTSVAAPAEPAPDPAPAVDDDPPATTLANLFRQKASPIRFFLVILIWAVGVLIVAVDTKRRTTPHDEPHDDHHEAPSAARPATTTTP